MSEKQKDNTLLLSLKSWHQHILGTVAFMVFMGLSSSNAFATEAAACAELLDAVAKHVTPDRILEEKKPLFDLDPKTYAFRGLTPAGFTALRQARDAVRQRERLFDSEFRNMSTMSHGALLARIYKTHMLLYGPGGGAKSKFVDWQLDNDAAVPFKILFHQMVPESALIGGQDFEAAKRGEYRVNIKGSLADHAIAVIDESDQGTPQIFSTLFKLLERSPQVWSGQSVQAAKTETVFFTMNANLPELQQQFIEQGMGAKFPALMNRILIKAMTYNWLSLRDRAILHAREERKRELEAIADEHPEVLKNEVFLKPDKLDLVPMRKLAKQLFKLSPLAKTVFLEFLEDMRAQTNRAVRESEERHQQNHLDEPFVYFPSADYTTRLDLQIPELIIESAFIDFLDSPLADEANIQAMMAHPIELDPLSLWRGFLAMTTLGPGYAKLKFDPNGDQKIDVDFDWSIDPSTARDKREELLIQNLKSEQERFRRTFLKHIAGVQNQIELRSRNNTQGNPNAGPLDHTSFELMMAKFRGGP